MFLKLRFKGNVVNSKPKNLIKRFKLTVVRYIQCRQIYTASNHSIYIRHVSSEINERRVNRIE